MEAAAIVQKMFDADAFSQWLGIELLEVQPGEATLRMCVTKQMLNGFGIAHGGITYSLADSALAFASNSVGKKSLSIETSISHLISLKENDCILAQCYCESESTKLGHYKVKVTFQNAPDKIVALFKGIVYKTSQDWV
ncbi:MAG: hotdog fold thioesterase [Bacteroidota bacterium]